MVRLYEASTDMMYSDSAVYMLLYIVAGATDKEIKDRFKQLALKWHPDKNPDDPKAAEEVGRFTTHPIQ